MFLTPQELVALTGLKRPGAQYAWLRDHGWPAERDARNRPLVLRSVVEARMGACVGGTMKVEPDFGALRPPANIPTALTLEELRSLPEPTELSGVYFLWYGDNLRYVGQSVCVVNRINSHEGRLRFSFDRATHLAVEAEHMRLVEDAYIARYQPPCNRQGVTRPIRISL